MHCMRAESWPRIGILDRIIGLRFDERDDKLFVVTLFLSTASSEADAYGKGTPRPAGPCAWRRSALSYTTETSKTSACS
jgi:hypothetical protein